MALKRNYLKEEALENLKNYKYQSGKYTSVDTAMQKFWVPVSEMLPMWMAPNLVTLIGLCATLISILSYIPFDLNFE